MRASLPRWFYAFSVVAFWVSVAFTQPATTNPSAVKPEDEAALRAVVEQFFALYAKGDLEGFMKLWDEKSPDYAARRKTMEESFAKEEFRFSDLTISRMKAEGENASLRVGITMVAVNRETKKERQERLIRSLQLVRRPIHLRVWRYVPTVNELAEALIAAPDELARQKLLMEERELFTPELGVALRTKGGQFYLKSDFYHAQQLLELSQKVSVLINDKPGLARAYQMIGNVQIGMSNFQEGLRNYEHALSIFKAINDKEGEANTINNIGAIEWYRGDYEKAINYYEKAMLLYEEIGNTEQLAKIFNNIGLGLTFQSKYAEALKYFQRAKSVSQSIDDKVELAKAFNNIGIVYSDQGAYTKAIEYYEKALPIYLANEDKLGFAEVVGNIGTVYERQGNYIQAIDNYQKILPIIESTGNKHIYAAVLNNIGAIYSKQGDYVRAKDYLQKTLLIQETIGYKHGIAVTKANIGNIHNDQGEYSIALNYFQQALSDFESLGQQSEMAGILDNIGNIYFAQGDSNKALQYHHNALSIRKSISDRLGIANTFYNLSRDYIAINQVDEARKMLVDSVVSIEQLRANAIGGEQGQQQFFDQLLAPYYALSWLSVSQNKYLEALIYIERGKSRTLLDVLQSGRINVAKAMTTIEREQESKLQIQLSSLNKQILQERQRTNADAGRIKELETQLTSVQLAVDDFQTRLYASHPELKVQRGEVKPLSLPEAAALLPNQKTALLEFAVIEDKTLLFVLTKAATGTAPDLKVFSLPIKAKELTERAQKFRARLGDPNRDLSVRQEAKALYEILLKPAQAVLQGKTSLVIVPDSALWELPFQALVTPTNRFLIEDANISYAPSLTYLREMRRKRAHKPATTAPTLLAMGNPALAEQTVARAQFATRGGRLEPLKPAEDEVHRLATLYGAKQSKVYVGAEALEERFKAEAGKYSVLHLATHGILNDSSPMYSQILLSQAGGSETEDGLLEAREILEMDLQADLVVLSACETARGRVSAGEGTIGLSWALFVAGVPTTVVSQWKVLDTSTQQLMVEFHRQLRTKPTQPKAEALRQAMLKLLRQPGTEHPFYWAPFVMMGDGQ